MAVPQVLYVQVRRINARSTPQIGDNVVGFFLRGDPVQVDADMARPDESGWVWRKLVASETHWVAEFNQNTGEHLLAADPPELPDTAELETRYVDVAAIILRDTPQLMPDNAVGRLARGEAVQVMPGIRQIGPAGWVWRRLVGGSAWAAEYHSRTGKRLLALEAPTAPVADEARTRRVAVTGVSAAGGILQGRVRSDGTGFLLDGAPFRFIGVNLREFPFYEREFLKWANAGHQQAQLDGAREMRMRVIRMHACNKRVSVEEAIPLVRQALDLIDEYGMLAIVCLNDALGDSEYYVPGDEPYHKHKYGHLDKTMYYVEQGYRQHFLPYVQHLVPEFAKHRAVFAWELANEPAIIPQPASVAESEAFYQYAAESADLIRSLAPDHLITLGLVNTGHVAPTGQDRGAYAQRLYSLPNVDFATVHFYQDSTEEQSSLPDLDVMKQVGKPLIVEEFGPTEGDKASFADGRVNFWLASGAVGFMQWGLSATPVDIGVGDSVRGMDPFSPNNRDHYNAMKAVYRKWGEQLGG
ncbi:MAG: cellulase family glycosylhydrolase [Anaerolineae bacterium]|nr:cellulase family glycosylhydrolase [Anaerolineae bacterium]